MIQVTITDSGSTWYHENNGYYFYVYARKPNRLFLKCIYAVRNRFDPNRGPDPLPKCPVLASMSRDLRGDIRITNNQRHNHRNEVERLETIAYRRRCKRQASVSTRDIRSIIEDESSRYSEKAVGLTSTIGLGRSMQRIRKENEIQIPINLEIFGRVIIHHPRNLHLSFQGERFFVTSTLRCVLFISPTTKSLLRTASTFLMDGTFKCVPRKPKTYQLYTIGAIFKGMMIPIVYCLMRHKEKEDYIWLFRQILHEEPRWHPRRVISDYEEAVMASIEELFRGCQVQGCWFHFSQAIKNKCVTLGLKQLITQNQNLHKIVKKLMALPLLPTNNILAGYRIIHQEAVNRRYFQNEKITTLFAYMRRQWLNPRLIRRISVHRANSRTNNHMESFHSNLMRHMGGNRQGRHPNIWRFTRGLKRINHIYSARFLSIQNGNRERWPIKKKWRRQNLNIARATYLLDRNNITINQFLNRCSHAAIRVVDPVIFIEPENIENHIQVEEQEIIVLM